MCIWPQDGEIENDGANKTQLVFVNWLAKN